MKQKLGMKANRAELFSRFGILLIFALVVLVASLVSDRFLSTDNILSVFTQCTVIGVLSCGMTMLIVSGNTDLSAGSGVALAGVVCALVINASGSWVLAVLATVAVMLLTSALQGILVSYCALVPFIVTLAGQLAFRGAAQVLSGGAPIIGVGAIAKISSGKLFGVSWLIIITILMVLFTWLIMNYTSFGRYIYATGGNSEAATAAGINVKLMILFAYLFAFGTGVGAPLFVYYLDSWLLRVGNQAGAISSVAVSMGIVLYWDILTKNSAQVNSLWLIFPASFITLVVVSLLTKKDNVKPVSDKGPDAVQLEILKAMKRGYTNAGAIITSMTQYSNDHELQAGHIHTALDSLEKSGYVTRKGQRLIAQLYFSLTEKGEATAVAHMGASELDTIAKYGVDTRALEFMQWIKSGDVSLSDISGKHSIYMMELSAISEHLSELGLVNVFGQGRLKASLTDAGQKLLQK